MDFLNTNNFELILKDVRTEYLKIGRKKGIEYGIDGLIVYEAIQRGVNTAGFHENTQQPDHFKQCAHLCYWLIKLKPIFRPKKRAKLSRAVLEKGIRLFDKELPDDAFNEAIDEIEEFDDNKRFTAVNELAAVRMCEKHVYRFERADLEGRIGLLEDQILEANHAYETQSLNHAKTSLSELLVKLDSRHAKFEGYSDNLAGFFREQTFSARSVATLFELVFKSAYF